MDMIFVRQGEYEKGEAAFPLIKRAAMLYLAEISGTQRPGEDGSKRLEPKVYKTEEGKPYIRWRGASDDEEPMPDGISVSITHSGDIWMCMVSCANCGIDFEYIRNPKKDGIAGRFFTEGERKYIEDGGSFFDVWVRREALGKYAGRGFFDDYPDAAPYGRLAGSMNIGGKVVFVHEITEEMLGEAGITPDREFRSACVSESREVPVVRAI